MGTFRELIIWQKSMLLITSLYSATKEFPKDETFGLTSQLRRCSVSIPSNIAEGLEEIQIPNSTDFLQLLWVNYMNCKRSWR